MATLIFMLGIVLLFYFVLIRPRQRQQRRTQEMLSNLQIGDEVMTNSGIYSQIDDFDEGTLFLRISDNTVVKISRQAIAQKIEYREDWDEPKEMEKDEDWEDPKALPEGSGDSD